MRVAETRGKIYREKRIVIVSDGLSNRDGLFVKRWTACRLSYNSIKFHATSVATTI